MGNPFSIGFGIKPEQYIPRSVQREEVINAFNNESAITPAYLILGVRGSGKTVMLDEISEKIGREWIIINLNSYSDFLASLSSKLYYHPKLKNLFVQKHFSINISGIGLSAEENAPAPDYETIIEAMLKEVSRKSLKVLIVIDEVENTEAMRRFASSFQIFIRAGLPVRLLMAGLPENILGLANERKSTFLLRTPRIIMEPLNLGMIMRSYQKTLHVSQEDAGILAKLTRGYSFAYQALGYISWGKEIHPLDKSFEDILFEYDYYLQEYSYKKIWEELSPTDKNVMRALASLGDSAKIADIRNILSMDSNKFNVYRARLKNQGLIDTSSYGVIAFSLPRFSEFVRITEM